MYFEGLGTTACMRKLAQLLCINSKPRDTDSIWHGILHNSAPVNSEAMVWKAAAALPVVFYSFMEHHSNCVLWREMDCIPVVRHAPLTLALCALIIPKPFRLTQ